MKKIGVALLLSILLLVSCGELETLELVVSKPIDESSASLDLIALDSDTEYEAEPELSESITEPEDRCSFESDEAESIEPIEISVDTEIDCEPEVDTSFQESESVMTDAVKETESFSDLLEIIPDKVEETTRMAETTSPVIIEAVETTADKAPERAEAVDKAVGAVYWVEKGEVWHTTESCPSLSRSKKISSGSISDATTAGKSRVCKRCGSS